MVAMVRSAALTGYAGLARGLGLDPERLTASVGLPATALASPELRVPASRVGRLLELSAQAANAEDFGLRLAETREPWNLGLPALLAQAAPTVREGIAALARYLPLHNEALLLRLECLDGAWLVRPVFAGRRARPTRQSMELSIGVLHRTLGALFGDDWRPELVCLAHPAPRDLATHRRVFGPRLQFDAPAAGLVLGYDAMVRRRRFAPADSLLARDARAYLDGKLAKNAMPFADRVRETIAWMLPAGTCSADGVASYMGLDRRTLHRRLTRCGTTYASLLDEVRRESAAALLGGSIRPLQVVAAELGFGSPSVFARWFRTRFDCTAGEWRRRA
jgi:AraC-like DNA-binding protein